MLRKMIFKKQWFYGIFLQKFSDSYSNIILLDENLPVKKTLMIQISVAMMTWVQFWGDLIVY